MLEAITSTYKLISTYKESYYIFRVITGSCYGVVLATNPEKTIFIKTTFKPAPTDKPIDRTFRYENGLDGGETPHREFDFPVCTGEIKTVSTEFKPIFNSLGNKHPVDKIHFYQTPSGVSVVSTDLKRLTVFNPDFTDNPRLLCGVNGKVLKKLIGKSKSISLQIDDNYTRIISGQSELIYKNILDAPMWYPYTLHYRDLNDNPGGLDVNININKNVKQIANSFAKLYNYTGFLAHDNQLFLTNREETRLIFLNANISAFPTDESRIFFPSDQFYDITKIFKSVNIQGVLTSIQPMVFQNESFYHLIQPMMFAN